MKPSVILLVKRVIQIHFDLIEFEKNSEGAPVILPTGARWYCAPNTPPVNPHDDTCWDLLLMQTGGAAEVREDRFARLFGSGPGVLG